MWWEGLTTSIPRNMKLKLKDLKQYSNKRSWIFNKRNATTLCLYFQINSTSKDWINWQSMEHRSCLIYSTQGYDSTEFRAHYHWIESNLICFNTHWLHGVIRSRKSGKVKIWWWWRDVIFSWTRWNQQVRVDLHILPVTFQGSTATDAWAITIRSSSTCSFFPQTPCLIQDSEISNLDKKRISLSITKNEHQISEWPNHTICLLHFTTFHMAWLIPQEQSMLRLLSYLFIFIKLKTWSWMNLLHADHHYSPFPLSANYALTHTSPCPHSRSQTRSSQNQHPKVIQLRQPNIKSMVRRSGSSIE